MVKAGAIKEKIINGDGDLWEQLRKK